MKPDRIGTLELHQVSHGYPEGSELHPVLERVDLSIARGELVVIVGRSGSGKTTLLNLMSGIDLPTDGRVSIEGVDLGRLDEEERTRLRRHRIGFVFQFFHLIPTLTAAENIELPMELVGVPPAQRRERVAELLAEVELTRHRDRFPDTLSGGEQQRVAIARALAHDPPILLADEPTGNLDLETGLQVLDLLDRMVRAHGKTMIMVTHSREVVGLADRVFSAGGGSLRELSSAEEAQRLTVS